MPAERLGVRWTDLALLDLLGMRDYISRDNPAAAERLALRIEERVERLRSRPWTGRVVPELPGAGCREVIVHPYRIVCQALGKEIAIVRVWHGRRDLRAEELPPAGRLRLRPE